MLDLWRRLELIRSSGEELEGAVADSAPDSEVVGLYEKKEAVRLFLSGLIAALSVGSFIGVRPATRGRKIVRLFRRRLSDMMLYTGLR